MNSLEAICEHVRCNKQAVISLTYEGKIIYLCKEHFNRLQEALHLRAIQYGTSTINQVLSMTRSGRIKIEHQSISGRKKKKKD